MGDRRVREVWSPADADAGAVADRACYARRRSPPHRALRFSASSLGAGPSVVIMPEGGGRLERDYSAAGSFASRVGAVWRQSVRREKAVSSDLCSSSVRGVP
eukprot:6118665-Pyramimonas_sp.AAC.1